MKIIILTSSMNIKYGRGADRVIENAKVVLNKEFNSVVYVSGNNIYLFIIGILKVLKRNPFSFSFIIFNAQGSIKNSLNPYWKMYYYFAKIFKIRRVLYWHEMPYFVEQYAGKSKFILNCFGKGDTLQLCCSIANSASALIINPKPNVEIVGNCIIPRRYNKNILLNQFTVITVGTIDYTKGIDIWTDVAINVCQNNNHIQFVWCGGIVDEVLYNECLTKIKEASLEEQITFLGHVEDASVITSFAHLYYCSSRLDSFPLAILEAMNYGKNIIYYDSGGVVEAVADEGVFIPNFSIELTVKAIVEKYEEFKINPDSVYNKKLQRRFYENYTPEIFVQKLKNALRRT